MTPPQSHVNSAAPAASAITPLPLCSSDLPLVLLPIRLETRFFSLPGDVTELRVRIYPDKIHLDSHEPDLLPSEKEWGAHYWEQDWRAGNDGAARAAAWRQLADHFGAERAAWVVRALRPTNSNQRPDRPTPPDKPLDPAPLLSSARDVTDGDGSAWRHPPQARLMPDRWIAVLKSGDASTQVVGRDIVRPLAAGPDPKAPDTNLTDDQLAVDPGMKWMVDFDEAEAKGMALRINVPPATLAAGLDNLIVFGVAKSPDGVSAAAQLAALLDAHHYTDGLEFLRFGTPTNNTDDRRASATVDDPGHERSYSVEVESYSTKLDAQSNATRVGMAFGWPTDVIAQTLGHIGQAAESHELDMRSMNVALWQVGWGYYLSNMVGFDGTGLTPGRLAWARDHFTNYVRSGGPFPILRCGRQPYGVLPVTSLDLWKPPTGEETSFAPDEWLRRFLISLRDNIWRPRIADAFRIGRRQSPPNPDADFVDVMRTDGLSSGYSARSVFGRHYLQHLRAFLNEDLQANGFIQTQDALAAGLLQRLGITWRPRLARVTAAEMAWPISSPLVQAGEVSPWRKLEPNYIQAMLAERNIDTLIAMRPDPESNASAQSLLQVLLRHAMLRELAQAAALIASRAPGADFAELQREVELVDLVTDAPRTLTWKRLLDQAVPGVAEGSTIRRYLEGTTTLDASEVAALGDFRRSLTHLQELDSERLQYLAQGVLDLSTHRIDAWITSYATKRLAAMSAHGPKGIYVGGYGWVEKLRPTPPSSVMPVATPPAGEPGPLVTRANDSGFIHAPSMTHAAAAALLRNAHLGATGAPPAGSPFEIDLSSRRAREAERLLDGVRQGQPLGALLGYRLERSLHDLSLDIFVPPLRRLAPLAARAPQNSATPMESIAANMAVDGLALHELWRRDKDAVVRKLTDAGGSGDQMTKIGRELDALGDAIDGLSDALTAETAYQIARGNTSRLASTLASIADGDAPPAELEVIRTPRTGVALTHRVLVLFSGRPVVNPGWLATNSSARASAEPMLNAWASKLLGDGRKVRCTIERLDDASGAVIETRRVPLSDVMVAPLDVVYGVEDATSATQPNESPSEIEQQVLYFAKRGAGGFGAQARLRLQHARPSDLAVGETTLFDVIEQARGMRRLLAGVRGADPEDLNPPERADAGAIDLVELEARVVRAENALNAAHKQLAVLIAPNASTDSETLRAAMMKLGAFGVGPATPAVVAGEAQSTLTMQASALIKVSQARLDRSAALRLPPPAADPKARCGQLIERMRAVFGQSFVVLPHFSFDSAAATELASALAASKQAQGGDSLAANGWFARYARVRGSLARMSSCMRGAEVLGAGDRLNLSVAQLPFTPNERWVGLPPDPGKTLSAGKLSLVLQIPAAVNTSQPLTGLLVDEWTEIAPNAYETTAITFQFDPPDSCAPQSILVAAPPAPGVDWTSSSLLQVLQETLDLAKLRAVDAETLGESAQYLPALYLAFNAKDDAVSTDFAPLTR